MFRARKGAKKQSKTRHVDEDEPEPPRADVSSVDAVNTEEVTNIEAIRERIKQKQKKTIDFSSKKRPLPVSMDEEDEETPTFRVKKGNIVRLRVPVPNEEEREELNEYSVEKLNALRAEQKFISTAQPLPENEIDEAPSSGIEETYIPLEGQTNEEHETYQRVPEEASLEEDDLEANQPNDNPTDDQWEAEQLRRAGIHATSNNVPLKEKDLSFLPFGQVLAKLTTHRSLLHEQHDVRSRDIQRVEVEMHQLKTSITTMENELATSAKLYDDVQSIWEFVSDLCFCLRAKSIELEKYEQQSSLQPRAVQIELWADVDDQYASLSAVLDKFEAWRHGPHGDLYQKTYGHLALQQLILPYIRVELLSFNPWIHRWEEHSWAKTLRSTEFLDLFHVGVELVAQKAVKMVQQIDLLSPIQIEGTQYLLGSLPNELGSPIHSALVQHTQAQPYSWETNAQAATLLKKHTSQLKLLELNDFLYRLCESELQYMKQNLDIHRIKQIIQDWPSDLPNTREFLREYSNLVHLVKENEEARALVALIEYKLQE